MSDCWADWIRTRRSGGDADYEARVLEELAAKRDRVLDRSDLHPGETLLDVGCGNGLIGFGALDRGAGVVVFTDVSRALLDDCRELASAARVLERCRFVEAAAEDLSPIEDESVDVVTTRSVLIYVKDKPRAFAEFHRVLRPGGRISLFEPINRFGMEERRRTWGYDIDAALFEKLNVLFEEIQPQTDPMVDFDERDLVALAESAGFFPVRLTYEVEIRPHEPRAWNTFLHSSWNPKVPTVAEAMDQALTPDERELLESELRPAVQKGRGVWRMGHAYLSGVKAA
ncbi:MAG TPA: class I SAM-dependent methyltransferase [Gaiellaceae bacterium]|nr:class I SAM-dependent methyltransferase [Gaiellaceae bacterium]